MTRPNNSNQSSLEVELVTLKQRLAQMEKRLGSSNSNAPTSEVATSSTPSNPSLSTIDNSSPQTDQVNTTPANVDNSSSQPFTIPSSAAILISFPNQLVVDVGQKDDYPITLPLFQEIRSASGELMIPANTPVSIKVKPHKGGAILVADSVIMNGQIMPINAQSTKIPGRTITKVTAQQMARQNGAVVGNLFTSFSGAATSSVGTQQKLGFLGSGIGILSGITSPDNIRVVEISPGTVHILKIK